MELCSLAPNHVIRPCDKSSIAGSSQTRITRRRDYQGDQIPRKGEQGKPKPHPLAISNFAFGNEAVPHCIEVET